MKIMTKRDVALWVLRIMVIWIYVRLAIYLVVPRDSFFWFIMSTKESAKMGWGVFGVLILAVTVSTVWVLFGWWILKSSSKIAARIVPEDGETGTKPGNTADDILRLVICCVGLTVATDHIDDIAGPLRLFMIINGSFMANGRTFFPAVFLLSLFPIFKPDVVARWTRAFPKDQY